MIDPPFYLGGTNISFRKEVFRDHGMFDPYLGRRGRCLLAGEDTEFLLRLMPRNIFFQPSAITYTKVDISRLNRYFFLKRIFWQAVSEAIIVKKHGFSKLLDQYDKDELQFSKSFLILLFKAISEYRFFEMVCLLLRNVTFKYHIVQAQML